MHFQNDPTSHSLLELLSRPGRLPQDRRECSESPRPCLVCDCRHHLWRSHKRLPHVLALLASGQTENLPPSCSLDVADRGEHSTEEVGRIMGYSGERIRQWERLALAHLHREFRKMDRHIDAADIMTAFFCTSEPAEYAEHRTIRP